MKDKVGIMEIIGFMNGRQELSGKLFDSGIWFIIENHSNIYMTESLNDLAEFEAKGRVVDNLFDILTSNLHELYCKFVALFEEGESIEEEGEELNDSDSLLNGNKLTELFNSCLESEVCKIDSKNPEVLMDIMLKETLISDNTDIAVITDKVIYFPYDIIDNDFLNAYRIINEGLHMSNMKSLEDVPIKFYMEPSLQAERRLNELFIKSQEYSWSPNAIKLCNKVDPKTRFVLFRTGNADVDAHAALIECDKSAHKEEDAENGISWRIIDADGNVIGEKEPFCKFAKRTIFKSLSELFITPFGQVVNVSGISSEFLSAEVSDDEMLAFLSHFNEDVISSTRNSIDSYLATTTKLNIRGDIFYFIVKLAIAKFVYINSAAAYIFYTDCRNSLQVEIVKGILTGFEDYITTWSLGIFTILEKMGNRSIVSCSNANNNRDELYPSTVFVPYEYLREFQRNKIESRLKNPNEFLYDFSLNDEDESFLCVSKEDMEILKNF